VIRIAELYCGLGGCATAVEQLAHAGIAAEVVVAVDIHRPALTAYQANHRFPIRCRELETFDVGEYRPDIVWMSPPCTPFSRKGKQRDCDDPRARSLLALLPRLASMQVPAILIENVPPMAWSASGSRCLECLWQAGYHVRLIRHCPTMEQWPMRRDRIYWQATRWPMKKSVGDDAKPIAQLRSALADFILPSIETSEAAALRVDDAIIDRYRQAIDIVDPRDPHAIASTFGSGYGMSHVRSGSYLRQADGTVRRFHPREIARLMGFPESFQLPLMGTLEESFSAHYQLLGNSIFVPVAMRWIGEVVESLAAWQRVAVIDGDKR
jgi:DNA (cytosine-5)-methyltransferase 1